MSSAQNGCEVEVAHKGPHNWRIARRIAALSTINVVTFKDSLNCLWVTSRNRTDNEGGDNEDNNKNRSAGDIVVGPGMLQARSSSSFIAP